MIDHLIIFTRVVLPRRKRRSGARSLDERSVRQFTRACGQNPFREAARVQIRRAPAQFDAGAVLTRPWYQVEHPGTGVTWSR